jgi:hypothetical protein
LNYTFVDHQSFYGVSDYRLKQTNFNGKTKDHGINSINRNGEEIAFPNPAAGRIEFQGPIGFLEYVRLYDIRGKNVSVSALYYVVTENQLAMRIDNLEKGVYFLRTKGVVIRFIKKLIYNFSFRYIPV